MSDRRARRRDEPLGAGTSGHLGRIIGQEKRRDESDRRNVPGSHAHARLGLSRPPWRVLIAFKFPARVGIGTAVMTVGKNANGEKTKFPA